MLPLTETQLPRTVPDVNRNSEVSFHDSTIGYLKFLDEHLQENPLNSNIVVSVRTDQKRALFVYAHDHFDNFVQVMGPSSIGFFSGYIFRSIWLTNIASFSR